MLAVPLTDYYEEVRRYLTCPEEVKDDLIYDVNRKVMDLNADRPDLDYNGILEFLGDPEDLANSLFLPKLCNGFITLRGNSVFGRLFSSFLLLLLSLFLVLLWFSSI